MNWNQLQYVITVAEEKSITKAAKKLYISQPSLSLSIQSLEKETGVTLFQREHGEMVLTYGGTLFYEWALSTLHSHSQLHLKLNDISKNIRNLIRFGISPHRSLLLLPSILEAFYGAFPNCEISIIEKPTYLLKNMLEQNQLDFIIDVPHPDTINYESLPLIEERIVLAVPAAYQHQFPFSESKEHTISLCDLSDYPFLLLSRDQILGNISRKMCEAASFYPNIRLTCENVETALSLVNRQLGITFVPEVFANQKRFYPGIIYYRIHQFHNHRQICLVYPKNRYQHSQLCALLSLFKEMVPSLYGTKQENNDPFYSTSNQERLKKSISQLEKTGGTVHEADLND